MPLLLLTLANFHVIALPNYGTALSKGLLYFEAQRSGKLPSDNRVPWRADSCLTDGNDVGKDLSRAYFDSGDHVVFGLPMSLTLTMMAYGLVKYGDMYGESHERAIGALKWGTDWLLRAHSAHDELYVQVGDGDKDHACWTRPEDMSMPRPSFKVDPGSPGSEPAAEAAAALAAASIVFKSDKAYHDSLLKHAKQLFRFADSHRGVYSDSVPAAATFYKSYSGFGDELLWGAAWLHRATSDKSYLDYIKGRDDQNALKWTTPSTEVSWDDKMAAAHVLISRQISTRGSNLSDGSLDAYGKAAESFVCAYVGNSVQRTAGGLSFVREWLPLQYVTTASFLVAVYGDQLQASNRTLQCSGKAYAADDLLKYSRGQADYILGNNPAHMSYMVGFGNKYPQRVHHRAASIPQDGVKYSCGEGFRFFQTSNPNPNVLEGAVVGGPDASDAYRDDRTRYQEAEASTYTTAPFLGLLARLGKGPSQTIRAPPPGEPMPAPGPGSTQTGSPAPTLAAETPKPTPTGGPEPTGSVLPSPSLGSPMTCRCDCGSF
jgi:endoglucanase